MGITPFIGAGFSLRYEFKNWTSILLEGAPPNILEDVKKWLDKNEYEEAAELLREELGNDGFQNLVIVCW